MAAKNFRKLFEPFTIKSMTLKNRIVMTPIGTNFAEHNGEVSEKLINYYRQRAKGGTGLITVEGASIASPQGSLGTAQLRIDHDNYIHGLYKLCDKVHEYGAKISICLNHGGSACEATYTNIQPVSASDIPSRERGDIPRVLTKDEIDVIVQKFADAARRAVTAGFDAVEVQAGHGYLLNQFLSPLTNDRTDEFGGSMENRARIVTMVLKAVHEAVGENIPIFLRISADELAEGGNTLDDTLKMVEYYDQYVDAYSVSSGLTCSIQYQLSADYLPDGWKAYMSEAIRKKTGKPCTAEGNIREPEIANKILEDGRGDFIAIGRGLIADPEWVNKVQFGNTDDINRCISCNNGCTATLGNDPIRCTINPSIVDGDTHKTEKITKPCNVVVIGGGTAGLEAACTAAEVGCTTILIEKTAHLGGLARRVGKMPNKRRLGYFPKYLEQRASELKNLFICKNVEATADFVDGFKPDLVVNASGSTPRLPDTIKGLSENIKSKNALTIFDLVDSVDSFPEDLTGKKVVVIGGGNVGLDVVEFFAPRHADVTIVEQKGHFGEGLDIITKTGANDMLKKYDVTQYPNATLLEVKEHSFVVKHDYQELDLDFDYGFICLGMESATPSLRELYDHFIMEGIEVLNIGDSAQTRRIIEGVKEGRDVLLALERRQFL
ncbi:MAG: FAD-dependent oxidoreductase [Anaerostipes sp.]|jgi:2,4-dienoyl-CoA reductase-like NADH-dependent reductase (Old Yellow Enzyme family)/thioredoxin reductase|nr:FAD-dependent oxidoreductase [Anaerostipes sp.]MDD3746083.1 FAD-dependent oxidoreductase [Anaerostipes sp.]